MHTQQGFDELIDAGRTEEFVGWDFEYLRGRMLEQQPSWSYRSQAKALVESATALLDLGTGDGAFLASLMPLPVEVVATEEYPPNVPIARERLGSLGVEIVATQDNQLPFDASRFDLVLSRHASFDAAELRRVLKPSGRLLTQQVGSRNLVELNDVLGSPSQAQGWDLKLAQSQLEEAGFDIIDAKEEFLPTVFKDVGAIVYYLRAVPWQVDYFDVDAYRNQLRELHHAIERDGGFTAHEHRFLVEGVRR